jgi:hypothetical protein
MPTTRPTRRLSRRAALAAAPTLLLLAAACGGDDGSAGDVSEFCDQATALDERFSDTEDVTSSDFGEAIEAFTELEPPEQIADEWDTMLGSFQGSASVDPADPEVVEEIRAASDKVNTFMDEECGVDG